MSLRNDSAAVQQDQIPMTTRESVISLDVDEKDFLENDLIALNQGTGLST